MSMLGPVGITLLEKLGMALAPVAIRLEDESHRHAGHAGARADGESHFALSIAAPAFRGKPPVERHRMVNAALATELQSRVHALAIKARPADAAFVEIEAGDPRLAKLLEACGLASEASGDARFIGLAREGTLIACGGVEFHGDAALLRSIAVAPEARGRGHGQAVVLRLMGEAGGREMWLLTEGSWDFFAGLGFAVTDRGAAPAAIQASAQFMGKRCAAATAMRRRLAA
jgi:BolA protein